MNIQAGFANYPSRQKRKVQSHAMPLQVSYALSSPFCCGYLPMQCTICTTSIFQLYGCVGQQLHILAVELQLLGTHTPQL